MKSIVTHPNFDYLRDSYKDDSGIKFSEVEHERFWDGWPKFVLEDAKNNIEHRDVTYIGDFSTPVSAFESYFMIRWIIGNVADKVRIIMPFFPVATMEREDQPWQVVTAKYFADMFSKNIPMWRSMKPSIHNFDIHALWVKHYYDEFKVTPEMHTTMSLIKEKMHKNTVAVFPDEWAYKRFKHEFKDYDTVICEKRRWKWWKRTVRIKEWDISWRDGMLIDDLIQTWGTLVACWEQLKNAWATKLDAYAPHWVFPHNSHVKVADAFDTLYISDTIPVNRERTKDIQNMEILEIAWLIRKLIA